MASGIIIPVLETKLGFCTLQITTSCSHFTVDKRPVPWELIICFFSTLKHSHIHKTRTLPSGTNVNVSTVAIVKDSYVCFKAPRWFLNSLMVHKYTIKAHNDCRSYFTLSKGSHLANGEHYYTDSPCKFSVQDANDESRNTARLLLSGPR